MNSVFISIVQTSYITGNFVESDLIFQMAQSTGTETRHQNRDIKTIANIFLVGQTSQWEQSISSIFLHPLHT